MEEYEELTFRVPRRLAPRVRHLVEREIDSSREARRLELVKVLTRVKGHVCNWPDLEKEIMRGALG